MHLQPANRALRLLPLVSLLTLMPACASLDTYTYKSTVGRPTTIEVVDPYTQKVYFSKEIPVDDILKVHLSHDDGVALMTVDWRPATSMTWKLYDPQSDLHAVESGRMDLPGTPINIVQKIRQGPEYPITTVPPARAEIAPPPAEPPPAQAPETVGTRPILSPNTVEPSSAEPLTIELSGNTGIAVGAHQLDMSGLKDLLAAVAKETPERRVVVRAGVEMDNALAHKVLSACHGAGLNNVTFVPSSTQPSKH